MNYERLLWRVRAHPALWGDLGAKKEAQATRLILKLKKRLERVWSARRAHVDYLRGLRYLRMYE
jgi:hypothetical protein